ncbi:hypothetical protein [Sporosarcina sp. P16b]|uniref:hypothetical protein n=1 Tax=Sporosarcina sp. P16b TaxID=2048261 RepID=UPI0013041198|nr:hypothetical protein [Sporosarcina sp. P16b]
MREIDQTCEAYRLTRVILGIETTAHYYEGIVRVCNQQGYIARVINAATTSEERKRC